ncbi:MAG: hypothetical protein LRZ91_01135 [Desulfotomaculum sp.]|nr:hypothetical protein [Desulfotomaculum sp.]MCL0032393.1 hypothetical protein [Peptococcaceae bacterium]MCL0052500.1 hypothetical protein [Peptococcaceae bacterium]MCL0063048.1 hypothetical protein [Peptococcaceae bacterium]MCL0072027.1 hypothetical protein [Peptococcaceae bacterium]
MITIARRDWQKAVEQLNYCDDDMLEYTIYKIHVQERGYMALLTQARKQKLTSW